MLNKVDQLISEGYSLPEVTSDIPHGDMPGDKICIDNGHIEKAKTIFPLLLKELKKNGKEKAVISVCGGSGVGKSEIASILGHYLRSTGLNAYVMSGDNYPHRIPMYNDAERIHVFREAGVRGMVRDGVFTQEAWKELKTLQEKEEDADPRKADMFLWFDSYLKNAEKALTDYLGTPEETDFDEVNNIIKAFHDGAASIYLRRMGRTSAELWYEQVDFSNIDVLILEWTHGNSDYLAGIDIPVFLNSTPEETLAHRKARNRDGKTDSAFTTMVLGIEQKKLFDQAHKAKIIITKAGKVLTYEELKKLL